MVLGWILTAIGMSFGAPFWFETLGKLLNLKRQFTGGSSNNNANAGNQSGTSG